ncbi:MAG: hypothetical protein GY862_12750 [Gammaproteobacteria bacterium]|nr:hypothetical protein [Gammaproteobacteria bacterium]
MPANAGIHAAPQTIGCQGLSLDSRVPGNDGFKKNGPSCPRTRASMQRPEPPAVKVCPWIPASAGMTKTSTFVLAEQRRLIPPNPGSPDKIPPRGKTDFRACSGVQKPVKK